MKRITLPEMTGTERTNAEVIVDIRFLDWATDDEKGIRTWEQHHLLRGWDQRIPEVCDITTAEWGAAPGSRVAIVACLSFMNGRYRHLSTEVGRVPYWVGADP